jgi:hypothetical protein
LSGGIGSFAVEAEGFISKNGCGTMAEEEVEKRGQIQKLKEILKLYES